MILTNMLKLLFLGLSVILLAAATPLSTNAFNLTAREDLPPADPTGEPCGKCLNDKGQRRYLYASGKCNTLDNGEKYHACQKPYRCGICMLFKGEQCK